MNECFHFLSYSLLFRSLLRRTFLTAVILIFATRWALFVAVALVVLLEFFFAVLFVIEVVEVTLALQILSHVDALFLQTLQFFLIRKCEVSVLVLIFVLLGTVDVIGVAFAEDFFALLVHLVENLERGQHRKYFFAVTFHLADRVA